MPWLAGLIAAVCVVTLMMVVRRCVRYRETVWREDALKTIATAQIDGHPITIRGLAGALNIAYEAAVTLADHLGADGWLRQNEDGLSLTEKGNRRAVELLRAHRLMECYLRDEAGMPLQEIHVQADRREHALSVEQVNRLNEHLGHPDYDPHGDPIPTVAGRVDLGGRVSLRRWPAGVSALSARVVHVEDEPPGVMARLLRAGVKPGVVLRVVESNDEGVTIELAGAQHPLTAAMSTSVHVVAEEMRRVENAPRPRRLADLPDGDEAKVIGLTDDCRGLVRRRLLDLGLTPGAAVRAELANARRSGRAYRIRHTLIALRREQADQVLVTQSAGDATGGATC